MKSRHGQTDKYCLVDTWLTSIYFSSCKLNDWMPGRVPFCDDTGKWWAIVKSEGVKRVHAELTVWLIFMIWSDNSHNDVGCPCTCTKALIQTKEAMQLHRISLLYSAAVGQESYVGTVSFQRSINTVCLPGDGNRRGQVLPGPELLASFMCPFALVSVCQ